MAQNLTMQLPAAGGSRQAEVSGASWTNGANPAGTAVIGVGTTQPNPKASDWPQTVDAVLASQRIGTAAENCVEPVDGNDNFAFAQADAQTANSSEADSATGMVNRSGATIESGDWIWGTVPVA